MLNPEKTKIAHAFNRAAETYHKASEMQLFSGKKLIHAIPEIKECNALLDLGCGTGRITKEVAEHIRSKHYYAIDIAEKAIIEAKHITKSHHINFMIADFDHLSLEAQPFSLIFSNMALHWSNDINQLFKRLHALLEDNGRLAFSIPLIGTLKELHKSSVKNFSSQTNIIHQLEKNDFLIDEVKEYQFIKQFDCIKDALRSLKLAGVTQFKRNEQQGLFSKHHLKNIYQGDLANPSLTYKIGIFIGRKQ